MPMVMPKHRVLKYFWPVLYAASYPISISMAESAEYHLHTLLKGEKGAFRRNWRGEVLENAGYFSTGEPEVVGSYTRGYESSLIFLLGMWSFFLSLISLYYCCCFFSSTNHLLRGLYHYFLRSEEHTSELQSPC